VLTDRALSLRTLFVVLAVAAPMLVAADERNSEASQSLGGASTQSPLGLTAQLQAPPPGSLGPAMVDSLAPVLSSWIKASRDAAVAQGVERMPAAVHEALEGYVPGEILERARWRVGGGDETSLQYNIVQFGDVRAVTLDDVVVFKDDEEAHDAKLWAHEIKHVMQFADWGITGFAKRYLQNYEAVESEAADYRWQWMKEKGLTPPPSGAAPPPTAQ
jgi:hypothetical protein